MGPAPDRQTQRCIDALGLGGHPSTYHRLVVGLLVVAFLFLWAGAALLIDAWSQRDVRPSLAERLAAYATRTLSEEAQTWLSRQ